jgi:RNA polymerase sigma-70 factor (ECF subfamily)
MTARQTSPADDSEALSSPHDAAAWLDEHGDALYGYARARVSRREVAEDLVQDTFLAALQARDRFQGRSSVRTWLLSILRHKILDHYRRIAESRAATHSAAIEGDDSIRERYFSAQGFWKKGLASWRTPEKSLEDGEFWDVLEGCLSRLPRALSAVFVLRELEGREMKELGRALALSAGSLRVRLHRARLLLRECLERRWFCVAEAPPGPRRAP